MSLGRALRAPRLAPLMLLAAPVLAAEQVLLGPWSYLRLHDTGDSFVPELLFLWQKSSPALLFPGMVCGMDRLGYGRSLCAFPDMLFGLLPGWAAYQLFVLLATFCSGFFTARLLRDHMGQDEAPAALAGLLYAAVVLDGFNRLFLHPMLAFLPLLLWAAEAIAARPARARLPLACAFAGFYALTGNVIYAVPFTFPLLLAWALCSPRRARLVPLALLALAAAAALHQDTIRALLGTGDFSQRAIRSAYTAEDAGQRIAATLWRMLPALPLAAAGALTALRPGRHARFFLVVLAAALAAPFAEVLKTQLLDGPLRGFNISRFYLLAPLAACVLGGLALGALRPGRRRTAVLAAALLLLAGSHLAHKAANLRGMLHGETYAALYGQPEVEALAVAARSEAPLRVASIGLQPARAMAHGLETADGYCSNYPLRYQRFWARVIAPATRADAAIDDYFNHWGNRVVLWLPAHSMQGGTADLTSGANLDLLALANVRYLLSSLPLRHPALKLRTAHLPPPAPRGRLERIRALLPGGPGRDEPLYIYEYRDVLPRFFAASGLRVFDDEAAVLDALQRSGPDQWRDTVYAERASAPALPGPDAQAAPRPEVTTLLATPDRVTLRVRAAAPAAVVVLNSHSPYWTCAVDGAPTAVFPAYGAFLGAPCPAGEHEVDFRYAPPWAAGQEATP